MTKPNSSDPLKNEPPTRFRAIMDANEDEEPLQASAPHPRPNRRANLQPRARHPHSSLQMRDLAERLVRRNSVLPSGQ
jgi:hypothetical protein